MVGWENLMYKKRCIIKDDRGISPVLETLVAVGICISLLAIFFIATTNIFSTHERLDVDLEAKCVGIMEALVNSPGTTSGYNSEWEDEPGNVDFAGLATTRTIAYGNATIKDGEVTVMSYYSLSDSRIGIAETCFLAGTKIVLADESYKNIEDIKIGDMVKSFDDKTGKIADEKVTNVFHHSPGEMGDYYLVINKQLKVTPNHMFYSNGNWICAGDLKIGDPLFYKSSGYTIYSIDKIFEKKPTYNFEVEGSHSYFVALDKTDVLVHNIGSTQPPTADFTWFDCDGPYRAGQTIFFNAENSKDTDGYIKWYNWWWNWGVSDQYENTSKYCYHNFTDNNVHYVRLKVIDDDGASGTCIYTVQANKPATYEIEPKPWVLTSKNIYPETGNGTFAPYGEGYNIKYTSISDDNYIFEVKEKNKPSYIILDSEKIQGLSGVIYYNLKSALGFNTTNSPINFNISIVSESGVYYYGANYSDTDVLRSSDKKILIYHGPEIQDNKLIPPYYEEGEITVRAFLGGVIPNYPPSKPKDPFPTNGSTNVLWNVVLEWSSGGDANGDPLTYDVFLSNPCNPGGEQTIVFNKFSSNQTETAYAPGILGAYKNYYWKIVAWDDHDAKAEGPIWHFRTEQNYAPTTPIYFTPANVATEVNVITANLTWTCSDPNQGDRLCYEVNFSKSPSLLNMKVSCANWNSNYWDPKKKCGSPDKARLDYNTTYYWKIDANDTYNAHGTGPVWNFTTAEKGLDQYCTYGSGVGEDTSKMLGQTFIAYRTGNLTKIKLSLKNVSHSGKGDITVKIYECPNGDPNMDLTEKATAIIPSFDDTSFIWKEADFSAAPIEVIKGSVYFVVVDKGNKLYSWQFSPLLPTEGEDYTNGNGWYNDGYKWARIIKPFEGDDFLFKTYVFRDFRLDQHAYDSSDNGETTGSPFRIALAQTFTAGQAGDLMKVNLTIRGNGAGAPITVRIYDKLPTTPYEWNNYLANTTIKSFDSGHFISKSANFTENPAYLVQGNVYYIVIPTVTGYELEYSKDEGAMESLQPYPGKEWLPLKNGFNFETYMDDIY